MNYYELLGLSPTSKQDEIKKRFHQKIKVLHPDKRGVLKTEPECADFSSDPRIIPEASTSSIPTAGEGICELIAAWKVLSNPEQRKLYDSALQ